ncbi:MAG: hypothetical protein WBP42_05885 [Candidatus Zixiibacteriota bacterium]
MNRLIGATAFAFTLILALYTPTMAERLESRILMSLNPEKLQLNDTMEEGGGTFAVIRGDTVVLAEDDELLLIHNQNVCRKIKLPLQIVGFDFNWNGDGVVLCDSLNGVDSNGVVHYDYLFYEAHALEIGTVPMAVDLSMLGRGDFVDRVDMVDDSLFEVSFNISDFLAIGNIRQPLEPVRIVTVGSCGINYGDVDLVAKFDGYYVYLNNRPEWNSRVRRWGIEVVKIADNCLESRKLYDLGELGEWGNNIWHPLRFDESVKKFYTLLVKDKKLELREFDCLDLTQ